MSARHPNEEMTSFHRPKWIVRHEGEPEELITARYDTHREWCQDPVGYHIIKVFYDEEKIGVRFFTNDHVPRKDVVGTNAEEIVQTIVRENLVGSLQHAAYLGHELHKAEVALRLRLSFVQDSALQYDKKTSKKESDNLPE